MQTDGKGAIGVNLSSRLCPNYSRNEPEPPQPRVHASRTCDTWIGDRIATRKTMLKDKEERRSKHEQALRAPAESRHPREGESALRGVQGRGRVAHTRDPGPNEPVTGKG